MSMIGNFLAVGDNVIAQLLVDPERVTDWLYEDEDAGSIEARRALDIDKAWHGIHFLLMGTAWEGTPPLNFILGGRPIGDVDVGYGPARALFSSEVSAVAAEICLIDDEAFRARFDATALGAADVYPNVWDRGDEEADYLVSYFSALRSFVMSTAEEGLGMLVWID